MAGYPYVTQVKDATTQKALISAFDLATKVQSDLTALIARVDTLETPVPSAPPGTDVVTTVSTGGGSGPAFGPYGPGDLIGVDTASTLLGIADVPPGNVLVSGGINTLPAWAKLQLATHVIGILQALNGGTGLSSYVVGDLLYASAAAVLAKLADVATGNALISGGVGAAPAYGKIGLTTHVTGTLPVGNGGTGATTLLGAGLSTVVASTVERAETGSDANVLTYTAGGADEVLLVLVAVDVSALTGTSVAVTVTWKDSNNATQTSTVTLTGVADGTINLPLNAKASQNVVVSTVFVGVSTAYNISAVVCRLK